MLRKLRSFTSISKIEYFVLCSHILLEYKCSIYQCITLNIYIYIYIIQYILYLAHQFECMTGYKL